VQDTRPVKTKARGISLHSHRHSPHSYPYYHFLTLWYFPLPHLQAIGIPHHSPYLSSIDPAYRCTCLHWTLYILSSSPQIIAPSDCTFVAHTSCFLLERLPHKDQHHEPSLCLTVSLLPNTLTRPVSSSLNLRLSIFPQLHSFHLQYSV
jgi:hypothetical protein